MFGQIFRQAWQAADGAGKMVAGALATGAQAVGDVAVFGAKAASFLEQTGAKVVDVAVVQGTRAVQAVHTTTSDWVQWMNVEAARTVGALATGVAAVSVGPRAAALVAGAGDALAAHAEQHRQDVRREREAAAARAVAAARRVGNLVQSAARKDAAHRVQASEKLRGDLQHGAKTAGDAMVREIDQAGRALTKVGETIDREGRIATQLAFSALKPNICLPCLRGELQSLWLGGPGAYVAAKWNHMAAGAGEWLAEAATTDGALGQFVESMAAKHQPPEEPKDRQKTFDGQHVYGACQHSAQPAQTRGVLPAKCSQHPVPNLKRITFVNGINTRLTFPDGGTGFRDGGMCDGMQAVADAYCAEVVGIYNSTEGLFADLQESKNLIASANSDLPVVESLAGDIENQLRAGQPVNLVVHSEGGLITQQALKTAKRNLRLSDPPLSDAEVERMMKLISVDSYGTAVDGWPVGPEYRSFVNTADPVPRAIRGAQKNFPAEVWKDSAIIKPVEFTDAHKNPIESHGLGGSYLKSSEVAPLLKPAKCPCG
ncbi:MAG: hypothetical protein NTY38_20175 [Acidobacteria bacterium]|nr:hypothetical protein [Acidobacteriota bacterium]